MPRPARRPLLSGEIDLSHVISADGSRVFWTDLTTNGLYMRENPTSSDAKTVEIAAGGRFWTASADGSRVFYTNGDLYEYEVENGQTTDLTPGVEVVGVVGASEDGEYLYYVDSSDNLYLWHAGISTLVAANLSSEDGGNGAEIRYRLTQLERTRAISGIGRGRLGSGRRR